MKPKDFTNTKRQRRVVVFGIFDGIHEGHRSLFRQAKEHGDELAVIVGRDSASLKWKGKKPKHLQETRLSLVAEEALVDQAVLGDEEQSSYTVLEELSPDIICLGYDQDVLEEDLHIWLSHHKKDIPLVRLQPFQPKTHHNSLHP